MLVDAEHHALAFLAQITFGTKVDDVADFFSGRLVELHHLGDVIGDQIHVLHGQHRQLDADHAADLACPQTTGIYDVLALDHALVGDDAPGAVRLLFQRLDLGLYFDGGAAQTRGLGVGVGGAAGVQMAFVRVEQGAQKVFLFNEGEIVHGFLDRDDFGLHAQVAATRHRHLQKLHALGCVGQHDAGRLVQAAALAGDAFELFVQGHGVALQHGHIRVAIEGVETTGCVPGGAGGELVTFQQHHVTPAFFSQVVEHRASHHTAANNYYLCCRLHVKSLLLRESIKSQKSPKKNLR